MEEHAEPVVLESFEAVPAAFHFLDEQVESFGGSVRSAGVVVGEDLGLPPAEGTAERSDLFDLVAEAADDGLVDEYGSVGAVVGEVDVTDRFLIGQPGAEHLIGRVADP